MNTQPSPHFAPPRIDARALLGLYDPADSHEWGAIRAAQLNGGGALAAALLGANLLAAALVAWLLMPVLPAGAVIGWTIMMGIVAIAVSLRRRAGRRRSGHSATVRELRASVMDATALAIVWAIPPLAVGLRGDADSAFGLLMVVAVLMTASALSLAALPLATISFLLILGSAAAIMMGLIAGPTFAAAITVFTALLLIGCFSRARALVIIRASELALAERDDTISLLLREFEDHSADWLWEIDAQRTIVRASPRFAHSVGLDPVTVNGMPFLQVLAGRTWEAGNFTAGLRLLSEKLKGREPFRDLVLAVPVGEEERWWSIAASPRFDESGAFVGFRGVGSDVTEQRASTDKINRMARFDTLTGLPNRLLINEALGRAMGDAEKWSSRCAFMMIDLDRFKAINDTLGHPIGDRLLGRVSERLGQLVTENEMIGRLGGDEFAVVVRDASSLERLEKLARLIIDTLSRPYEIDAHTLFIGASIGIAVGPRDGRTTEMLIRSADLALYRSKDAGGGTFHCYEPQLHVDAEERRVLELALRQALNNNEMHLHYQPVVDARTGALTGFEALLRWTHPQFGAIPPTKFVPLAEETHMIAPIGEWVLRSACAEAARWDDPVRVAVNVSPEQLYNPAFVTVVASALANSGLPAERLELEVTESVFMREGTCAVRVLEKILDMGVRLSLDDFGTGYSSLGYLSRTRFSSIKIDRSFVTQAAGGAPEAVAIIRAVVALAGSLGMATTAEGVETEDEHVMVQQLGCTKVQGYYFGRPLPVAEARTIASRGRRAAA
ncbi:putative bifunctional diguanylate cyclase/phosphodiesterase [Sphingomonas qilianensis]|uniref:EAL domain-containing protein n=1 Tax=Sphingomonas qilianensis TaxID=1736690 RepID=A0ABU9XPJ9_9SPHN